MLVGTLTFISGLICLLHLATWINCIAMIIGYYTNGYIGTGIVILFFWGRTIVSIINIIQIPHGSKIDLPPFFDLYGRSYIIIPIITIILSIIGSFLGGDTFIRGQRAISCVRSLIDQELTYEEEQALRANFTSAKWESDEMDKNNHIVTVTGYIPNFGEKLSIRFKNKIDENKYEVTFMDIKRPGSDEELDPIELYFVYSLIEGMKAVKNAPEIENNTNNTSNKTENEPIQQDISEKAQNNSQNVAPAKTQLEEWDSHLDTDNEVSINDNGTDKSTENWDEYNNDADWIIGYYTVNSSDGYANLRSGPGTNYDIIMPIPNGERLGFENINDIYDKWHYVYYAVDGEYIVGYMHDSQIDGHPAEQ